ncbi:hypothetical protein [Streptomyces anthocyanicus]|uniref:hypothetical protein n=1 Tax=Streptomyces anthocyanicus TaxID=68174 RepID=UPI00380908FF
MPQAARARRLRRLTVLALGVTTALTLSACAAGDDRDGADTPTPSASPSTAPRGLLTKAEAKKAVDNYEKINNRANANQDVKLLGSVEAGQIYEQSSADFEQWETWSEKEQKHYESAFFYRDREYLIPAVDSGASWFAVKAHTSAAPKAGSALVVFDKVDGAYKVVMTVYSDEALPEIAVDEHGYVTPADPSQKVGGLAPDALSKSYEDFFETGGKTAGKTFAETKSSKGSIEVFKGGVDKDLRGYATEKFFAKEPAHPKVYALRLKNGGAVALFPTAHTSEMILKPRYMSGFDITPGPKEAVYDGSRRDVVTDEFEGQALAVLSPKAKPQVTGIEYALVDSR